MRNSSIGAHSGVPALCYLAHVRSVGQGTDSGAFLFPDPAHNRLVIVPYSVNGATGLVVATNTGDATAYGKFRVLDSIYGANGLFITGSGTFSNDVGIGGTGAGSAWGYSVTAGATATVGFITSDQAHTARIDLGTGALFFERDSVRYLQADTNELFLGRYLSLSDPTVEYPLEIGLSAGEITVNGLTTFTPDPWNAPIGSVPFVVGAAFTGLVVNLNADLLDGQHGSYYQTAYTNLGTILTVTPRISANSNIALKVVP